MSRTEEPAPHKAGSSPQENTPPTTHKLSGWLHIDGWPVKWQTFQHGPTRGDDPIRCVLHWFHHYWDYALHCYLHNWSINKRKSPASTQGWSQNRNEERVPPWIPIDELANQHGFIFCYPNPSGHCRSQLLLFYHALLDYRVAILHDQQVLAEVWGAKPWDGVWPGYFWLYDWGWLDQCVNAVFNWRHKCRIQTTVRSILGQRMDVRTSFGSKAELTHFLMGLS